MVDVAALGQSDCSLRHPLEVLPWEPLNGALERAQVEVTGRVLAVESMKIPARRIDVRDRLRPVKLVLEAGRSGHLNGDHPLQMGVVSV